MGFLEGRKQGAPVKLEWFRFKESATQRASRLYPDTSAYFKLHKVIRARNNEGKWGYAVILPK